MLDMLALEDAELSLLLCSDTLMQDLNREHRHIDRSTDVLSFPMEDTPLLPSMPYLLGDVVIALDTARRQARAHGVKLVDELTLLLAHGLLHLLGCDHGDRHEERRMLARTEILAFVGGKGHTPAKLLVSLQSD